MRKRRPSLVLATLQFAAALLLVLWNYQISERGICRAQAYPPFLLLIWHANEYSSLDVCKG
jgi:hypothetical protein